MEENMKNFLKRCAVLLCSASLLLPLFSCKSGDDNDDSGSNSAGNGGTGEYTVYLLDKPASGTWGIWYWLVKADGSQNGVSKSTGEWPVGATTITGNDSTGGFQRLSISDIDSYTKLGLLFVNKDNGKEQTGDVLVPVSELKEHKTIYFTFSNPKIYYLNLDEAIGIMTAQVTNKDGTEISITTSRLTSIDKSALSVKGSDGTEFAVSGAEISGSTGTITISNGNISKLPYTITYGGKSVDAQIKQDLIDEIFKVEDSSEFGIILNGNTASFKMWAPLASKVQLALYADSSAVSSDSNAELKEMTFDNASGIWSAENVTVTGFKYYKYAVTNGGKTNYVADIWSKAASADSVASQICDINSDTNAIPKGLTVDTAWGTKEAYYNPFGKTGTESKKYTDASIYEMHIRDWSRVEVSDSTGKFLDIANGDKVIAHLKDLGITHVQILPMFDYAQTNADTGYNWGYNPYHYNVPEGRYVKNMTDGTDAVQQLRTLIGKLHEAGIAVNMDVVYNHTNGTGSASLYDMTVPEYFYRLDSSGNYYNGSGCGNEVATNHAVVKKYVIESLKHWMLDYHINGFRFDLMGLHESSTMSSIYTELSKIDQNVMVYGEPWTGGDSGVKNGCIKENLSNFDSCSPSNNVNGVGYFNDTIRDAIKGSVFDQAGKGQVQGVFSDDTICKGLLGSLEFATVLGRSLNYVECHDNQTLFDRLAYSNYKKVSGLSDTQMNEIKAEEKLTAAYIFLAQGTPFINGGQEFMRTKQNDHNSYISSDVINQISLSFKETYADVYNIYKGLIALRKANPAAFGANTSASAETVTKGVTKYVTGDFCVYFNATDTKQTCDAAGYAKSVDVSSGTPTEAAVVTNVPAKSFVILKK